MLRANMNPFSGVRHSDGVGRKRSCRLPVALPTKKITLTDALLVSDHRCSLSRRPARIESLDGLQELDGLLKISLRGNKLKGAVDFGVFDL